MVFSLRSAIRFLILGDFLLLPIAHLKFAVFGLPFYMLEIPILAAATLFCYGIARKTFLIQTMILPDRILTAGITLFISGTILSFVANPFSLTGLGQIKSWVIFPLIAVFLWLQATDTQKDSSRLLIVWLASSASIAVASLSFLSCSILTYDGRLEAWYASPNFLAIMLVPGILISIPSLNASLSEKKCSAQKAFLFATIIALLAIALFFTRSYNAWIAAFISIAAFFIFSASRKTKLATTLGIVTIGCIFLIFEYDSEKWRSATSFHERSSLSSRVMIWQSAGRILADHPIIGIGIGRFQEEYLAYQTHFPPYLEWAVPQPHNLLVAIWLETGLLGITGYAILFMRSASLLWNKRKTGFLPVLCILIFFFAYGIIDTPFFKNDLAFLFWMLIASSAMPIRNQSDRADASTGQ